MVYKNYEHQYWSKESYEINLVSINDRWLISSCKLQDISDIPSNL